MKKNIKKCIVIMIILNLLLIFNQSYGATYSESYKLAIEAGVKSIRLSETSGKIKVGNSKRIKATTITTKVGQSEIAWKSSNTNIATVSSTGKITARMVGTATITATYKKDESIKAEYQLTVVETDEELNQDNTSNSNTYEISPATKVKKDKTVQSFVEALEVISERVQSDYKKGIYWKYTNGVQSENKLPFKYTFAEALSTNTRTTNCADFIMWGLNECGVFAADQKFYGNKSGGITYKRNETTHVEETLKENAYIIRIGNKTTKQLIKDQTLKRGDICIYKGHTNAYAGDNKWFDAGRKYNINGHGKRTDYTFTTLGPVSGLKSNTVQYIIRLKNETNNLNQNDTVDSNRGNILAATKPTSASQLKLYETSSNNPNPIYLKSPVTGKTEKVQSFAITDMGTSNETIWYAFQAYNNKYEQTLINAYNNNKRVYSAALDYGGEGQGVDIDKIGDNTYSIYCQR